MGIHSGVPAISDKVSAEDLVERVSHIATKMIGENSAMRARDIMESEFGLVHRGTDQPLRKAMKILLCKKHVPIVSNTNGFFVAEDRGELLKYRQNMIERTIGLKRNIDAIDAILRQADIHEHLEKAAPREATQQSLHYREI